MGLVGESGCGKTTLMLGLLRLLPAAGQIVGGSVQFMGQDITAMNEDQLSSVRWNGISIVFQGAMNALNPVRTVGDQIREAIYKHRITSYNVCYTKLLRRNAIHAQLTIRYGGENWYDRIPSGD